MHDGCYAIAYQPASHELSHHLQCVQQAKMVAELRGYSRSTPGVNEYEYCSLDNGSGSR
jgi:hypothetical protein